MILEKRDERKIKFLTFYVMPDVGSMNFKIFTLIPLNIVSQTLKIAIDVFSKYRQLKLKIVTQSLKCS